MLAAVVALSGGSVGGGSLARRFPRCSIFARTQLEVGPGGFAASVPRSSSSSDGAPSPEPDWESWLHIREGVHGGHVVICYRAIVLFAGKGAGASRNLVHALGFAIDSFVLTRAGLQNTLMSVNGSESVPMCSHTNSEL